MARFGDETYDLRNDVVVFGDNEQVQRTGRAGNDIFRSPDFSGNTTAYGDFRNLNGGPFVLGGDDQFIAGANASNARYTGDSMNMSGGAVGGRDSFSSRTNSNVDFVGDADSMSQNSRGGADTIKGSQALAGTPGPGSSQNMLIGDGGSMNNASGGDDSIYGGGARALNGGQASGYSFLVGDGYEMWGTSVAGRDLLQGGDAQALSNGYAISFNSMVGDGYAMEGKTKGGIDRMFGGDALASQGAAFGLNIMAGDGYAMFDSARSGQDTMYGGDADVAVGGGGYAFALNVMAGDTFYAEDNMQLAMDTLKGGVGDFDGGIALNLIFGDVGSLELLLGLLYGGFPGPLPDNLLSSVSAFADPGVGTLDHDRGPLLYAADHIVGGQAQALNFLIGDSLDMRSGDIGGNDTLVAGGWGTTNILVGDGYAEGDFNFTAQGQGSYARGGNDRLYSGKADDVMIGDGYSGFFFPPIIGPGSASIEDLATVQVSESGIIGGADIFFFAPKNGEDVVLDFHAWEGDKIDLTQFLRAGDFASFGSFAASGRIEYDGWEVVLHLDPVNPASDSNTVTLFGVYEDLMASAFVF